MRPVHQPTHLTGIDADELAEVERLLLRLRVRAPGATGQFFDRYQAQVNHLVWALLGADAEHDDLVNSAFEAMLRGLNAVRTPHSLKGWVRTVTINTVRLEFRRRKWRRLFSRDETATLAHPDLKVGDAAQRERTRDVYRALEGLDADSRLAMILRHIEGYELTEVAAALGCSLATIKRRLEKAETRLAAVLGGAP